MRAISMFRSILIVLIACVLMGAPSLAAQTVPPPDGITVLGLGQASAPADSTLLQFTIGSAMFMEPSVPGPGATPGAAEMEAAQPVVDSLVAAGAEEADISVIVPPFLGNAYSGPFGPASALVEVTVNEPTAEDMVNLVNAATVGAAESGMIVGGVVATHTVNDCAPLENEAREASFANAQQQADAQADVLGVTLGDVVASRNYPYGPSYNADPTMGYSDDGSCSFSGTWNSFGPYGPMPYDVAGEPEVIIYVATEFTFRIDSGAVATPTS